MISVELRYLWVASDLDLEVGTHYICNAGAYGACTNDASL